MTTSRTVVITGVTRGLGYTMTQKFIELGHTVVGCGRSNTAIEALQAEFGQPHQFNVVDVIRDDEVANWAKEIIANYGSPDLLLNNAALMNPIKPLWQLSADEFDPVIDVNIKGVANIIRHFVPTMVHQGSGITVNFSSGWGRGANSGVAPYCASKWAIEGLTQSLAQELPTTMAAVSLNPGIIDTDMLKICFGEAAEHYPSPEQWAEVAVPFLLNIKASDNGQPLTVPVH